MRFWIFFLVSNSLYAFKGLPEGPNKKYILQNCLSCHALSYIENQRLNRTQWNKTIKWMEEEHNLKFKNSEVRKKVLDYLEKHFSEKKGGDENPMGNRYVNPLPFDY